MKKILFFLGLSLLTSFSITAETIDFDAKGNIIFKYGNLRFEDKDTVDFATFSQIRIFDAINHDDWETVQKEIESGIGINSSVYVVNDYGMIEETLLGAAIMKGSENVAKKLIENGADVNRTYEFQFNGQQNVSNMLGLALTNSNNLSEQFMLFLLNKVEDIPQINWPGIGMTCSVEICEKAERKFFDLHNSDAERSNFILNLIYGILMSDVAKTGEMSVNDNAENCIITAFTNEWAIRNKNTFLQDWDLQLFPYFNDGFKDDKNWKEIIKFIDTLRKL